MNKATHDFPASLPIPMISKEEYRQRIERYLSSLDPNSVAIFVSNPVMKWSRDVDYSYRQASNMLYLVDWPEPYSALVLTNIPGQAQVIMFVQPRDEAEEDWTGYRLGTQGAIDHHLADQAYTEDKFAVEIANLLRVADNVYYEDEVNPDWDKRFTSVWQCTKTTRRTHCIRRDPIPIISAMRMIKSDQELAIMRHLGGITRDAHVAAMRACCPGKMEYHLQAVIRYVFMMNGCSFSAYPEIVGGGGGAGDHPDHDNGCILHYTENRDMLKNGDIVLIDAGCWNRYASDITTTFPVGGRFSEPQKLIYQLVLDAHEAGKKAARLGRTLHDVHLASAKVLRAGLFKLGILPPECRTRKLELKAYRKAKREGTDMPLTLHDVTLHYVGHWLGMDVHDVGLKTYIGKKLISQPSDKEGIDLVLHPLSRPRELEEGMCHTIEPGVYLKRGDKRIPERFWGIAVRIERDYVITADGAQPINPHIPTTIAEIEAVMNDSTY